MIRFNCFSPCISMWKSPKGFEFPTSDGAESFIVKCPKGLEMIMDGKNDDIRTPNDEERYAA